MLLESTYNVGDYVQFTFTKGIFNVKTFRTQGEIVEVHFEGRGSYWWYIIVSPDEAQQYHINEAVGPLSKNYKHIEYHIVNEDAIEGRLE